MIRSGAVHTGALSVLTLLVAACGHSGGSPSGAPPPGSGVPTPTQRTNVLTYKNDVARTGQNLTESVLTPANVNFNSFGKLRVLAADGKVDAQPLYVAGLTLQAATHNVAFVATENDSVYAFDVDSGALLWHVSLLGSGETVDDLPAYSCDQVSPTIGITSTPVIDLNAGPHGIIYVVAMSKSASSATYHQRLHALDLSSGAELLNGPVDISATYATLSGTTSFDPAQYEERAALLLLAGTVYTSWTSHCDVQPYTGWIIAYSGSTLARTAVFNAAPNSDGGGPAIWMSGGGPAADTDGNVYVLTANGAFETALDAKGFPNQGDYGNSFLKLSTAGGTLTVSDYFALYNVVTESVADQDLGSGGIMLLPDLTDSTGTVRHLAVGAGKDGNLYVVSRDSLGKFNPATNNIWQQLSGVLGAGVWSTPAYFNGTVYYGPNAGALLAFAVSAAKLSAKPSSSTTVQFAYPGTSPAVSANGSSAGIVWAHENTNPAVLHAYDASNLGHELYNSNQAANGRDQFGPGNKFITPMIADGKVLVGTQNAVAVFGLID